MGSQLPRASSSSVVPGKQFEHGAAQSYTALIADLESMLKPRQWRQKA